MTALIVRNKKLWTGPGDYIGRGSVWGNDWSHLPRSGATHNGMASVKDAVFQYTDYLINGFQKAQELFWCLTDDYNEEVFPTGVLLCYCVDEHGNGPCHGKVIASIVEDGKTMTAAEVSEKWRAKLDAKRHLYSPRCKNCDEHRWEWPQAAEIPQDPTCFRCQGEGVISAFVHIYDGVCFRCNGTGIDPDYKEEA